MNNQPQDSIMTLIKDVAAIFALICFGWFLIGYYTEFKFLNTTYPDWMYHAFRIQSLMQHGFISWDHIWSNGINYWNGYQFIPHLFAYVLSTLFSFSATDSMIFLTAVVFIFTRVSMYTVMRLLKISPFIAFFSTICSFAFAQEWYAIKDFSTYIAICVIPFYIFVWIKGMNNFKYIYIFSAMIGVAWMFHPVLGYTLSGLLFFTLLFSFSRTGRKQTITTILILLISSSPFFIPYLFSGYTYANPILGTTHFLKELPTASYRSLSITGIFILIASWIITFIKTSSIVRWPRLLLLFCSFYMIAIILGQGGYFPVFINQLQYSSGIFLYIGIMLPFILAISLFTILKDTQSKFIHTILLVCLAASMAEAIYQASIHSAIPVNSLYNPVANYVVNRPIKGTIFTEDVAEASYFSPQGIRFINSYNEHAEPHPLAQRFNKLMKNDLTFTGISNKQLNLIVRYANVLGLEYLFIPEFSPLAKNDLLTEGTSASFKKAALMKTKKGTYAILKSTKDINYAYVGSKEVLSKISLEDFEKPTLHAASFKSWDEEVNNVHELIENEELKPVPLTFVNTDQLEIDLSKVDVQNKFLIIMQSYNSNWASINSDVEIEPTSLRFMYIENLDSLQDKQLVLKHDWPFWYWPVQLIGLITTFIVTIWQLFFSTVPKRNVISLEHS